MAVQYYQLIANDWTNLEFIINDLTTRVIGQGIGPTADVTFNSTTITDYITAGGTVTLTDLTASRLISTNASQELEAVANLASWVGGTENRVTVANDGDGSITLSTPQDTHTTADPTFRVLTITRLLCGGVSY